MKQKKIFKEEDLRRIEEWGKMHNLKIPPDVLVQGFIHRSYAHETSPPAPNNERLEYLGDAVISLVVAQYLYEKYPSYKEGELSRIKSQIVSARELGRLSRELKLGDCLLLGIGEEKSGGRRRNSLLCNTFEAVTGVIFIELGYNRTKSWLLEVLNPLLMEIEQGNIQKDYKTILQERVQKNKKFCPDYKTISTKGPEHKKEFSVDVMIGDEKFGSGSGMTKKDAEQEAAKEALLNFK